jgi:PAS domain S-box-containing protein
MRAEERLLDYELTVESLEDMIVVVSRDYRYVLANRAFLNYRGMERENIVGHLILETLSHEAFEEVIKGKLDECFQGKAVHYEMKYRYPHLGERDLLISYFPIEDSNGSRKAACVLRDITERRLAEQALHEAQTNLAHLTRLAAMGELVASIAHEVNQPLTGILTTSKCALREMEGGIPNLEAVLEAITEIAEDGARISDIISRIRSFVKKEVPDQAELNINYVIREAALLVSQDAARNDVQVRLDLAVDLPCVLGDRVQLQQVLINLAINGIDAMRTIVGRRRELVIRSDAYGDGVLIQVQDSGIGLNADRVDRIFEPFFTTKPQGMGMGLAISRSIIDSHGGRLWAEPGSDGAIFQITLPDNRNRAA